MARGPQFLKSGTVVWVPCGLKTGYSPAEQHVTIDVNGAPIVGFVPNADIRTTGENQGLVRSVVLQKINGSEVAVLLRGELLNESNPVVVPRAWLERVGEPGR